MKPIEKAIVVLGFSAFIGIVLLTSLNAQMQQFVETRFYVGTLESLEYEHQDWFSSVSATLLKFEDGETFRLDGHHVYEIGENYTVKYEKFGSKIDILNIKKTPSKPYSHLEVFIGQVHDNFTVYYVAETEEGWQKGIHPILFQSTDFNDAVQWALDHADDVKQK